jgi:shikimate dehydrogenase
VNQVEKTRVFAVLGDPVDHSASPAMQNAAFAAAGLPHLYLRARVGPDGLSAALDEARGLGMGGLNLTVPLKETALALVDRLTSRARRTGAVNTILARGGRLVGDNTDGAGFLRSLRGRLRVERARVVVLGAGGSARAIGAALAGLGSAPLVLANRTPARARDLAAHLRGMATRPVEVAALDDPCLLDGAGLVVNTTSAGLAGAALPLRPARAPEGCWFIDLVYGRATRFLSAAARAGRPTLDGRDMLLHQGALSFEAWTGRRAPLAAMRRALDGPAPALPRPSRPRRRPR